QQRVKAKPTRTGVCALWFNPS
ncbi:mreB/Mbl family protein, partial [Vibrio cholerae CP1035(8)]